MPELPEVETFRKYGERKFLSRRIEGIEVDDDRILYIPRKALDHLIGKTLKKFHRRGKYVFVETDEKGLFLILHFGMTGYLEAHRDENDRPKGTRVDFVLDSGRMAFVNPRKFGRVGLTDDIDRFFNDKKVGTDALTIDKKEFLSNLKGKSGPIKSRLMDQKNVAGIGNIYADEILFQCGIHPEEDVSTLVENDLCDIFDKMKGVFKVAIEKEARYRDFPKDFLLFDRSLERSDPPLKRTQVGGRTTFYCPNRQKRR